MTWKTKLGWIGIFLVVLIVVLGIAGYFTFRSQAFHKYVLAKIQQRSGDIAYIMETGYRERQGISPVRNRIMRFEPRPGWPRASPCTRPQVLVKGQPGVQLDMTVEFSGRRRHLPRVTITRAA